MNPRQARLTIDLLGPMQLCVHGHADSQLTSDKAQALLAYLASHPGQPQRRERLAGLLWPESPEGAARASLRNALAVLRRAVEKEGTDRPSLAISRHSITFQPNSDCRVDILIFEKSLTADPETNTGANTLADALLAYRGTFMEGFTLADCAEFEEWLTIQREHYRRLAVDAYGCLVTAFETSGDVDKALDALRRQVTLEPWLEEGHRRLMALLASNGRRSDALAQFRRCRQILVSELGVEPDEETQELHRRIRDDVGLPKTRQAAIVPLPMPLTPLIGRESELADLAKLLANPDVRLVTILGPGGIGKTHLALCTAQAQQERYPDGVAFVPFAPVHDAARFANTVGQALGLPYYGEGSPKDQLFHYLQDKRLLLVLDNLEHLLAMSVDIMAVLRTSPHLTVLCTSRSRLGVHGEHCYTLDCLAMSPAESADEPTWQKSAALDLFVQSGRRSDPLFAVTAENSAAVVAICRAVEGLPLGIILAASWLDMLSPAELATRIASPDNRWFDLLESDAGEMPSRHRSLRAVVESVWSMLSVHEQTIFAILSIFRGGFDAEAALAVADASLHDLRGLAAKSCLQVSTVGAVGRYQIHEYLRQYGFEQLQKMADAEVAARSRHATFFLAKLRDAEFCMKGDGQTSVIESLAVDGENTRAAWRWAAERKQIEVLRFAIEPLCRFYEWRGLPLDGVDACRRVIEPLSLNKTSKANRLLSRAHAWHAVFCRLLGSPEKAARHEQQAMERLNLPTKSGEPMENERAHVLICVGTNALYHDDMVVAEATFRQSLKAFVAIDDRWGDAYARQMVAWTLFNRGEIRACLKETTSALAVRRSLGDTRGIADSLMGISMCFNALGELTKSLKAAQEALIHAQACDARQGAAGVLGEMARTYLLMGQPERGADFAGEVIAQLQDFGMPMWIAVEQCTNTSDHDLHLGRYFEAGAMLNDALAIARQQELAWPIGAGLVRQAKLAKATGKIDDAEAALAEAIPLLASIERLDELDDAYITLATCAMLQGDVGHARQHLAKGLQVAVDTEHYATLCHGMAASALLAAVEGDVALAGERYAVALSEPYVTNSHWFADVYEQEIVRNQQELSTIRVPTAKEQGKDSHIRYAVNAVLQQIQLAEQTVHV